MPNLCIHISLLNYATHSQDLFPVFCKSRLLYDWSFLGLHLHESAFVGCSGYLYAACAPHDVAHHKTTAVSHESVELTHLFRLETQSINPVTPWQHY